MPIGDSHHHTLYIMYPSRFKSPKKQTGKIQNVSLGSSSYSLWLILFVAPVNPKLDRPKTTGLRLPFEVPQSIKHTLSFVINWTTTFQAERLQMVMQVVFRWFPSGLFKFPLVSRTSPWWWTWRQGSWVHHVRIRYFWHFFTGNLFQKILQCCPTSDTLHKCFHFALFVSLTGSWLRGRGAEYRTSLAHGCDCDPCDFQMHVMLLMCTSTQTHLIFMYTYFIFEVAHFDKLLCLLLLFEDYFFTIQSFLSSDSDKCKSHCRPAQALYGVLRPRLRPQDSHCTSLK